MKMKFRFFFFLNHIWIFFLLSRITIPVLDVLDGVLDPVYFGIHFLRFHAARQTGPSPRLGEPVAVFEAGTATLDITDVTVIV